MKKKILSIILVLTMIMGLISCAKSTDTEDTLQKDDEKPTVTESASKDAEATPTEEANVELTYDEKSSAIYNAQLGEYYKAYQAVDSAKSISERFALQAIAEAKLMEAAVMLPIKTQGGLYAISRVAPYTVTNVAWGNDSDRFHQALVATEFIKAEHRKEMKEKWNELKGTGTYEQWAKSYLAEKGYTLKDSYSLPYTSDPVTWDILATSRAADSEAIVNTFDGLLEYDIEGIQQPALAERYEVSADGLTYTFYIRKGVKWVDSQGREVAEVKADDFVAGMQHMMDAQGGLEYLIQGIIKNADQYISGEITDFSQVGVKALDDYTLQYTLEKPCSYFTTMLGYGVFAPMCRSYYISKGGKFGQEYDPSAPDYTYAKDPDSIAYCGPYLVTNATAKNTIVFKANESYWNKDKINIKKITWYFNDGSDVTKAYNDMKAGVIDGAGLNTSTIPIAKSEGLFDEYAYISSTTAVSYMGFYNLNRAAFANVNDGTAAVSTKSEEDKARTNAAMNNVHFRRAISFAVDRGAYNAQIAGEDLKYNALRNSYTPGTFVVLEEDTTVQINGVAKTFPAGTYYGEIMQAQIDADGVPIKVWDPAADDGIGSSDGFDGWYNPDNARAELNKAIEELAAQGVTIDDKNPIILDLPYPSNDERYTNQANAFKQSVEKALNGMVTINLIECKSYEEWYYSGYYTDYGYEANYDIYDLSGWGPDYGDPSTYLDTFLPDYAGYMVKCIGIY